MKRQCYKCPWKVTTDPLTIPGGYSVEKHHGLVSTIAEPGSVDSILNKELRIMACHESPVGDESPCVGWLHHQLGDGNNLALRFAVAVGQISADYELVGEQHTCIEDTFPKG